ncbi:MAG: GNAT family N-acetyltransferase, partial [Pseudomonadales bacterium]
PLSNRDQNMISLRKALQEDVPIIAQFNVAMALETEDKTLDPEVLRSGVRRMQADASLGFYLVALRNNEVAGCLGVTFEWSDWRDGLFWWIQSVFVDPSHRGCGVFTALYRDTERLAIATPEVIGLRLYADQDNDRAIRTYHRLGMRTTEYRLLEVDLRRNKIG